MDAKRLYVICSNKLNPVYSCVQGAHAVAQYLLETKEDTASWKNEYLIFLKGNVNYWSKKLGKLGKKFTSFCEPDLGNKLTAIALVDSGELFKHLELVS